MVFRTVLVFAVLLIAWVPSKVVRVILKLFPPMTVDAMESIDTGVFIISDFVLSVPSRTLLRPVGIQKGLAAEILPIVGVNTVLPLVITLLVGTPPSLEMETIEVCIPLKLLNEIN
jgi:hypothetical protein